MARVGRQYSLSGCLYWKPRKDPFRSRTRRSHAPEPLPTALTGDPDGTRTRHRNSPTGTNTAVVTEMSGMSFVGDPQRAHRVPSRICGARQIPDASWGGEPYTTKAIIVHLPELTGESDLVSITSRDIDAEIGVLMMPN